MPKGTISPAPPRVSQYGVEPKYVTMRGADLDGMTSVGLRELIPDLPDVIYPSDLGAERYSFGDGTNALQG